MIEHLDAALEAWLTTLDPPVEVAFERQDDTAGARQTSKRPVLSLVLTAVREQNDKRDNRVDDVRTGGRVVARQKATRFFELDYLCSVNGSPRDAHRALGDLVQLFVDHDTVPVEHIPTELAELGYPIDVLLVAPQASIAAVTLRVVMPVVPTANREIGPPATSLHLDMAPPPVVRGVGMAAAAEPGPDRVEVPIEERKWTTVRRRELIGRQQDTQPAAPAKSSGGKAR